jgi:hypothetical protein
MKEDAMKRIILVLMLIVFLPLFLSGCSVVVDQAKQVDASMAGYLGKEKLSLDCKAGIAQADMDMASDAAPVARIKALQKYANQESQDFKECYAGIAWLGYVGAKAEGTFKSAIKKLTELGLVQ